MARARSLAATLLPLALVGCGSLETLEHKVREEPLTDRCADFMHAAFPGSGIEVTKQAVAPAPNGSVATLVVAVEGTRKKLPAGSAVLRDVAVECRFDEGILTSFRWTKGPLR